MSYHNEVKLFWWCVTNAISNATSKCNLVITHCHIAQCVLCAVRCHCIFYGAVSDTIRRRGGYRGISTEEGVDTVTYFGEITDLEFENHWDKYMFIRIVFFKF